MAIQLEKENSKFNIYEQHFLIDSAADLQSVESEYTCHQGDKAELPDGSYYLRHSDDYQGELWELAKSSGGGGGGGVFVVDAEMDMQTGSTTFNKTWQEIYDAMASGTAAYVKMIVENEYTNTVSFAPILSAMSASGSYLAIVIGTEAGEVVAGMAVTASADGYPVIQAQE